MPQTGFAIGLIRAVEKVVAAAIDLLALHNRREGFCFVRIALPFHVWVARVPCQGISHPGSPQTPAKAGLVRANIVRGGPARRCAMSFAHRRRVSRACRTTLPTVLRRRKRSRFGLAVCNSSCKPTRL